MDVSATFKVKSKGSLAALVRKIEAGLKGPRTVVAGLVAGQAASDVIAYGWFNHEGTSRGIPPRPFVKVAFFTHRGQAKAQFRTCLRAMVRGQANMHSQLDVMGKAGVKWIEQTIQAGVGPPLAASTVARKGHATRLIDTGVMLSSMSYKIR
jgi:hypothetical protein